MSYLALKQVLLSEFAQIASLARIHQLLATRSCRSHENLFKYFLSMKETAQRDNIDKISLQNYIT